MTTSHQNIRRLREELSDSRAEELDLSLRPASYQVFHVTATSMSVTMILKRSSPPKGKSVDLPGSRTNTSRLRRPCGEWSSRTRRWVASHLTLLMMLWLICEYLLNCDVYPLSKAEYHLLKTDVPP